MGYKVSGWSEEDEDLRSGNWDAGGLLESLRSWVFGDGAGVVLDDPRTNMI